MYAFFAPLPTPRTPRAPRFLPAVAVLLIGCAWVAAAATRGDVSESFDLRHETARRAFEYRVAPGTVGLEMAVEANVPTGALAARVLDPNGVERLVLRLERGRGNGTTGQVAAIAGVWRLEVEARDASGHGAVHFASR